MECGVGFGAHSSNLLSPTQHNGGSCFSNSALLSRSAMAEIESEAVIRLRLGWVGGDLVEFPILLSFSFGNFWI